MGTLNIAHWNDVYKVTPQRLSPRAPAETVDVTQFAAMLDAVRGAWARAGLSLFSGDVFSPSVQSTVTRGSHMVPVMNELAPDVAVTGNHDFDFGYPHLCTLIQDTNFPWLLSNVVDTTHGGVPKNLHAHHVLERAGVRVGVIGLIEREWITTVSSWPAEFQYRDMRNVGMELSRILRDPEGPYRCDLIIALTHARLPNDISLAKSLMALSPRSPQRQHLAASHGVDLILGGHDHLYFAAKGVSAWEGYDHTQDVLGAEEDEGDVLVVKSGCDFRDLSELSLQLEDTPSGSVRRKVVASVTGKRHRTQPNSASSQRLKDILATLLSSVDSALQAPVCSATVSLDLQSTLIRVQESAAGNWFADVIRHCYDDALCVKGYGGSDGVFMCAGTLRGDTVYGPGLITLGDILEILPFEDPVVVLELDGEAIWAALESSLETWPAQEGRFPVISGFRVSWDSRRPPGSRVLGVWLLKELAESVLSNASGGAAVSTTLVDGEKIKREKDGRKYKIVTREYMAEGHDGYLALHGQKYLVDEESGQIMSSLVRKYLMGSHFVNKMAQLPSNEGTRVKHRHDDTHDIIRREKHVRHRAAVHSKAGGHTKHSAAHSARSRKHYQDHITVCAREDMSRVDCFDGEKARRGEAGARIGESDTEELLTIHPVVDGRLKDEARGL